ncbi:MAG: ATP-binding protein [Erysipelotrichaceae bacterium]|nr:ATP-binding protein [Erysipelotrichaceae bacterium]
MERTFKATDEKLYEVIAFVEEELEKYHPDMKAMMAITVALEEMFVNVAHYAYPDSEGEITVSINADEDTAEIRLIDEGVPFDPLKKEDPDIKAGVEERDIGGLGIFMVKRSMDECFYERKGRQNIFTMKRKLRK